jgi:PAS domain S-box-containing protein
VETPVAIDTDAAQFSRALRNAILLPVGVILVVAALAFLLGYQFLRAVDQSDHSRAVGHQILELHETLLDLETTQLRYGLLGDVVLLQHYNELLPPANEQFSRLRQIVTGNRDLENAVDQLIAAKDMWIQHATGSIGQRQLGKIQDKDWLRLGTTLQENLNRQLAVIAVEQGKVRDERLRDVTHMKHVLVLACSALALILALAVGQIVRRQFGRLAQGHRRALHIIQQRHAALLRSETELEQQKEWFRVTLTSIGDGVIVTDKESRVVFMNHEAERLTGWSSVEALLSPLATVFRIIDEQTRLKMEISASEAFRKNKIVGPTKFGVLVGRAGNEWPIEDSAAPIRDAKGEVPCGSIPTNWNGRSVSGRRTCRRRSTSWRPSPTRCPTTCVHRCAPCRASRISPWRNTARSSTSRGANI